MFSAHETLLNAESYSRFVGSAVPKVTVNFSDNAPTLSGRKRTDDSQYPYFVSLNKVDQTFPDVLFHEYGHVLSLNDNIADLIGRAHYFGESNNKYGKSDGVRLGWAEGLANYIAVASRNIVNSGREDTFYKQPDENTPDMVFSINLEGNFQIEGPQQIRQRSNNAGEGDESSVMRILWDIGDAKNEPHDQVSLGHVELYKTLKSITPDIISLNDLWTYFYDLYSQSNPAELVKYGAIFEAYGVSPTLVQQNPPENPNTSEIPTFEWTAGNDGANDEFNIIVYNSDFSKKILESSTGSTTWQPSVEEWTAIINEGDTYSLVVAGTDNDDQLDTGAYWSSAYSFSTDIIEPNVPDTPNPPTTGVPAIIQEVIDNIEDAFAVLETQLSEEGLLQNLPFLGNIFSLPSAGQSNSSELLSSNSGDISQTIGFAPSISDVSQDPLGFVRDIKTAIVEVLQQISPEAGLDLLREQLFSVFGVDGLKLIQAANDIGINGDIDGDFTIDLALKSELLSFEKALDTDFGLPWLGLSVSDGSTANTNLNYAFDFSFGIEKRPILF